MTAVGASPEARVVLIRHDDGPPDDRVFTYLASHGFAPDIRRPYAGDRLGRPDGSVVGTVLYGGPFPVFETARHPFLRDEHRWLEACIDRQLPVLGICQGAQSIAATLGARCGPRPGEPHEFGYYRVHPTPAGTSFLPGPLHVAQSHFHEFETPEGGELLAWSDLFPQQAFRYGRSTFALQFHAEVTTEGFRRWQERPGAPYGRPGAQTRAEQDRLMDEHDARQAAWFSGFLGDLFGVAAATPSRHSSANDPVTISPAGS
ncbi:MAG: hypothetical protein AVDCRST_MAG79-2735 [uncultured Thermoleophilia bacterium]|uniref:Glutamine amidotransferase domain-containing protein n=1 Tax=uncultured Thermoleophilia bacterium TaxID=1497501 RepID=A0A6J4UJW8_9ACTN|nr:MAG: hypothetical protein AVDCRST_MAG79-2735 [uncultured Thermoleophilia bacterium]